MNILHVAAEVFPVVKTGGLGDVVAALPATQRSQGTDARLAIPAYPALKAALQNIKLVGQIAPPSGSGMIDILLGTLSNGVPIYAIDVPHLFDRPGNPYLGPDGNDWPDNIDRFAVLGYAAAQLAFGLGDPAWRADVLHAHDWHAGLAPAYVKFSPHAAVPPATILTIHNLAYQGLFPLSNFPALGLPERVLNPDGLEFWNQISFMKSGLVFSDRITTVSPGYAREIATPAFGCGLEGVIALRGHTVSGILNGVDQEQWNPKADPSLVSGYDVKTIGPRILNRRALIEQFDLDPIDGPLLASSVG